MKNIYLSTSNKGKVLEIKKLVGDNFNVFTKGDLGMVLIPEETGETLYENALIKAKALYDIATTKVDNPIVIADDTGLFVESLGGAPGVKTQRYSGENATDEENIELLLKNMSSITNRKAFFKSSIVLIFDNKIYGFDGTMDGEISFEVKGKKGFGYDPIFKPIINGKLSDVTVAEMTLDEKNKISHRSKAYKKLEEKLKSLAIQ